MKRGRTEEIQFGQPRVQPPTGQQRIITTTQPHNVAGSTGGGTTIQYQIPPNVIKTTTPPESSVNAVTNLSTQQQQQQQQPPQANQQLVPPSQTTSVQYTTSYNTTLGGNLPKGQQTTNPQQQQQQQQIYVVNASNQVRGTAAGHKNTVVNATSAVTNVSSVTTNNSVSTTSGGVVCGQPVITTTTMSPGVLPPGGGAGNPAQGPPPPPAQGQAQLQRLKVEDALSYLDQVKYRFGNQPQVYNDFLDIMKEFKSQSIDTPGVIQRVSNLFRGHPELIVGFNTFLPPGYKIEVQENEQGCYLFQVSVSVQPTASSGGTSVAPQPSPHKYNTIFQGGGQIVQSASGGNAGGTGTNIANTGSGASGGSGAVNLMAYGGGHAATAAPGASVPLHGGTPLQQPSGGSAGGNASPATAQNAQSLTTTSTAAATGTASGSQVPQNFSSRGGDHHRERTISSGSVTSNASLPTGVTPSPTVVTNPTTTVVTPIDASTGGTAQQSQPPPPSIHRMISQQIISHQQQQQTNAVTSASIMSAGLVTAPTQVQHHQQTTVQQAQPPPEAQTAALAATVVPTAPTATANQPVEFNHAITYVNKIKNRFHTQPEKYKRFLEILHTYQKEQKTYKEGAQSGCMTSAKQLTEAEVYTQVAQLFDNQEDLLREFGQFLPDATSHHNQAAMQQQHHLASSGKNNNNAHNMVLNASSIHDHPQHHQQHQQQQQLGGPTGSSSTVVGLGGVTTVAHGGSGGKKLSSSNVAGGVGPLTNLKVYNSMQPANMARLQQQQDRDYSAMGGDGVGVTVHTAAGVGSGVPPGSGIVVGGAGSIRTGTGANIQVGTGTVLMEKDRNHHMGGVMNTKYIHGTSLATMGAANAGGMVSGSNTLASGGPNIVSNMMSSLASAGVGSGGGSGGVNAIKRSPSYAAQMALVGQGGGTPTTVVGNSMGVGRGGDRGDGSGPPPMKRHKPICRDVSLAEASKYGTLNDYAFFDKVRKALRSPDVYENFLRCLTLYNQEIVSKSELQTLVTPFLARFPDLLKWFQDFLGPSPMVTVGSNECIPLTAAVAAAARQDRDRTQSELTADVDLTTCKRLGASYCALPKSHEGVKCSGRTALCRDVLNDTWVSFPTWAEDSTFVTSRKTQYEEFIYRCEDERFELDVVIETNSATIRVLEGVQKKLTRMSPDEVSRFRLDDSLGGTSSTIHQRALRRIYGDKAGDIIQGLKKNPSIAVQVVLRRMKAKEEEWREAQKSFNKQWREQNEKYYLKSLDHQGINFKQTDIKALRSKSLFNEIETLFDERHEQNDDSTAASPQVSGPHMTIPYKDKTILEDAANLLIHHVKRQTGIQKQEKARIKHILRQFVPDLFFAPRQQLSEDEREEDEKDADMEQDEDVSGGGKSSTGNMKKASGSNFVGSNSSGSFTAANSGNVVVDAIGASESSAAAALSEEVSKDTESCKIADSKAVSSSSCSSSTENRLGAVSTASSSAVSTPPTSGTAADSSSSGSTKKADSNGNNTVGEPDDGSGDKTMTIKTEIKEENDTSVMQQDSGTTACGNASSGASSSQQQPMSPPLPPHAISKHIEEAYTLFFTNNSWYLFLRLHAILCERLRTIYERAQIIAAEERAYESTRNNSTATALRLKPKSEIRIEEYYNMFLDMLKNLLDGNMESSSYEDTLREMFGIHAYIAFTLDRVVQNAVRQLQHCVTERGALDCVELFQAEQRRGGAGGLCRTANRRIASELAYQRKAEAALQDENCFKIYIYKIDCRVTMELLDTESDDAANAFANSQAYSSYVDRLSNPAATGTGSDSGGGSGIGGNVGGGSVASGGGASSGVSETMVNTGMGGNIGANSNHNNTPAGTNSINSSSSGVSIIGSTTGGTEVKMETPDDELKLHQSSSSSALSDIAARRRPLFLQRGLRKRRKNEIIHHGRLSVTIDGHSATVSELQTGDDDVVATSNVSNAEKSGFPSSSTINPSKRTYASTTDTTAKEDPESVLNDSSNRAGKSSPGGGNASPGTASTSSSSAKDAIGGNNNNNVLNLNNNSIGNSSSKSAENSSLWFGGTGSSRKPPSSSSSPSSSVPERLNGADRTVLYIDDNEQLKVNRNFKTAQVQKKKFTMYWQGSLTRSRKLHSRITTRMNRKFNAFNNRWLDRNASASQRASCADWLHGRRPDLMKNVTTLVVQDPGPNRTPYGPYNRYKVEQIETD